MRVGFKHCLIFSKMKWMCVVKLFSFDYFLFGIQSLKFEIGDLKAVVMIFFLYKIEILF